MVREVFGSLGGSDAVDDVRVESTVLNQEFKNVFCIVSSDGQGQSRVSSLEDIDSRKGKTGEKEEEEEEEDK